MLCRRGFIIAPSWSRSQYASPFKRRSPSSLHSRPESPYDATIENLKIGAHTRVIFQGFTGRQATANAAESLAWGTQIVGGVTPGRDGMHPVLKELPVFPTVKAAMENLKPDATGIYVAAHQAAAAIEEAIEAEIPLIVAVAEHIPVHDMLRIHSMLKSQSISRLVGANAPGIISPIGRCRIGFQPLPCFSPGHVGIVAKSGTLSYEAVASLTRAGLGQSLCIGMGGDMIAGTDFVDALKVFESDSDTHGIIIIGEVGGRAEDEAAEWITEYRARNRFHLITKPILALVAGKLAKPGCVMGHAGASVGWAENSADRKHRILQDAGVVMIDHPAQFGDAMKKELDALERKRQELRQEHFSPLLKSILHPSSAAPMDQRRDYHTFHRPRLTNGIGSCGNPRSDLNPASSTAALAQRRGYHISHRPRLSPISTRKSTVPHRNLYRLSTSSALDLLSKHKIITRKPRDGDIVLGHISVTIDRTTRAPCFKTWRSTADGSMQTRTSHIPFDFREGPTHVTIMKALKVLLRNVPHPHANGFTSVSSASYILSVLYQIFIKYEGIDIGAKVSWSATAPGGLIVHGLRFSFDDAAFKSCNRHAELYALRDISPTAIDPAELAAEADGIVYLKLGPSDRDDPEYTSYNIGTLVNGAGLAMNTVDALALPPHGGRAANFLDTGGKATAETVKKSFELLLADERVRVIFVNIFGGLTLGDMIARGILLAFRELGLEERGMPVVVRIRGTNEAEGQRILAESGLRIFAFDGFDEAAAKCVELAPPPIFAV
ncbi:succinyl-CoA synthetase-like protein [Mycena epipterygia]|nr:succinyl-CoA synthetase-like protein [Mycena epipterygia]